MRTIIIILFFSSGLFSQTIVHDKKEFDASAVAYQDSMTMYLYGQYQIKISYYVIKGSAISARLAMGLTFRYAELHNIKDNHDGSCVLHGKTYMHCSQKDSLTYETGVSMDGDYIESWIPDEYKYPSQVVIYKMSTKPKPKTKKLLPLSDYEEKPKPVVVYKIPEKKLNDTILMPSGERITRAEFESRYGAETYNFKKKESR